MAVLVAGVLPACSSDGTPAAQPSPSADAVLESREILGDPLLQLAEQALAMSEGLDAARHRLPRGAEMLRGLDALGDQLADLRSSISAAQQAAGKAPVRHAAAIVDETAATAAGAARAAKAELAFLKRIAGIDEALLAAADEWDRPGSQSEIRSRLDALAASVAALRPRAAGLRPAPRGCTVLPRNRRQWVSIVHSRTQQLQRQANSAGGHEYDRLRASFRALPLAEEPRTADRADRDCWLRRSRVAKAAPVMRDAVDQLRESLSG